MPVSKSTSLAVLIVGYKSAPDLPDLFGSLAASTHKNFTIIFVDNASSDGSVEWVRKHHPHTVVFAETENHGFAGGNNIGFKYVLENNFSHVFILNPDTVIDKYALQRLMEGADNQTIRQPLILLHRDGEKTDLVNTAGNILNYMGFAYVGGYEAHRDEFIGHRGLSMASGAGACIPTAALREVGIFAEYFFMYHEDVDLFWRMRLAGYNLELIPESVVWHKYHFSRNKKKFFYAERNRMFFVLRTYQWWTIVCLLPFLCITELLILAFSLKDGWLGNKLQADVEVLGHFPSIIKERRDIQKRRKLTDRQLRNWFSATFNFGAVAIPGVALFNRVSQWYWTFARIFI
jgi:GT2 family glycosyltransferase